jgi:hypothetical protein
VSDSQDTQGRCHAGAPHVCCACSEPYRLYSNHGYFPYSHSHTRQSCLHVGVIEHAIYLPSRCRGTWNDPFLKAFMYYSNVPQILEEQQDTVEILPIPFCSTVIQHRIFGPQRSRPIHKLQPTFGAADGKRLWRIKFLQN